MYVNVFPPEQVAAFQRCFLRGRAGTGDAAHASEHRRECDLGAAQPPPDIFARGDFRPETGHGNPALWRSPHWKTQPAMPTKPARRVSTARRHDLAFGGSGVDGSYVVNKEWLALFRKAKAENLAQERLSKKHPYSTDRKHQARQWWKTSLVQEVEGKARDEQSSRGGAEASARGMERGVDSPSSSDVEERCELRRRCLELEAALNARFDEISSSRGSKLFPNLPLRTSAKQNPARILHKKTRVTRNRKEDGAKGATHSEKLREFAGTVEREISSHPLPENLQEPASDDSSAGKESKSEGRCGNSGRGGAVRSTEMSKRWEAIHWPRIFDGSETADCLFVRSAIIRKDLLCKFDAPSDQSEERLMPETYVVFSHKEFCEKVRIATLEAAETRGASTSKLWVVKPPDSSNAVGVEFFRADEAESVAQRIFPEEAGGRDERGYILQEYISPMILDKLGGCKFHIRLLVVLLGRLKVFMHRSPRVLAATEPWRAADFQNRFMHISNKSVNITCPSYDASVQNVDLATAFGADYAGELLVQMENACQQVFRRVYRDAKMSEFMALPNCYELFGVDFVVNKLGRMFLLEVNPEPSMGLFPDTSRTQLLGVDPLQHGLPASCWKEIWSSKLLDAMLALKKHKNKKR